MAFECDLHRVEPVALLLDNTLNPIQLHSSLFGWDHSIQNELEVSLHTFKDDAVMVNFFVKAIKLLAVLLSSDLEAGNILFQDLNIGLKAFD